MKEHLSDLIDKVEVKDNEIGKNFIKSIQMFSFLLPIKQIFTSL